MQVAQLRGCGALPMRTSERTELLGPMALPARAHGLTAVAASQHFAQPHTACRQQTCGIARSACTRGWAPSEPPPLPPPPADPRPANVGCAARVRRAGAPSTSQLPAIAPITAAGARLGARARPVRIVAQAAPERPAGGGARFTPGGEQQPASSFSTSPYQSPSYQGAQPPAAATPAEAPAGRSMAATSFSVPPYQSSAYQGAQPPAGVAAAAAPAAMTPAPAGPGSLAAMAAAAGGTVVVQPTTSVSINGEVATNGVLTPPQIYEKVRVLLQLP